MVSYNLTLDCGCIVYVACDPRTQLAHTRVIERIGPLCRVRNHEVGLKVWLWELLPQSGGRPPVAQSRENLHGRVNADTPR